MGISLDDDDDDDDDALPSTRRKQMMSMTLLPSGQTRRHRAWRTTVVRMHEIDLFKTCSSCAEKDELEGNGSFCKG